MGDDKEQVKVKILVACHQPCFLPKDPLFVPVHGGRALKRRKQEESTRKWLEEFTKGDDTGINISRKNGRYNEMTVIYWAWKNYEQLGNPEYIGFMHYRRHFVFDEWKKPEGKEWFFRIPGMGQELDALLGVDAERIQDCIGENDFLYPSYTLDITVYEQYKASLYHRISDLDLALSIIREKHPDYYPHAQAYFSGKRQIFCNMFIMRKELFFEYCQWIFSILEEYDKQRDYSTLSQEEARFFISERLTGVFIHRKLAEGAIAKPLSLALVECPYVEKPRAAFEVNNIPVVFATDDFYMPVLGVALQSLVAASTSEHNYDIFVLHEGIDRHNIQTLRDVVGDRKNFSLRFIDIRLYFDESLRESLFLSRNLTHVSFTTYYRFVLGSVFSSYDKILYLDCDIIINEDVSTLYATELNDMWIGAVPDMRERIAIHRNLVIAKRPFGEYVKNELGVNENEYFQAGVLLYNIRRINEEGVDALLFAKAREIEQPILMDQDILNSVCKNHVHFLSVRWNIEWQIGIEFEDFHKELPFAASAIYAKALKNPAIIHYASPVKPWNSPPRPFSELWWRHAAKTPWYEFFLSGYTAYLSAEVNRRMRERSNRKEQLFEMLRARMAARGRLKPLKVK